MYGPKNREAFRLRPRMTRFLLKIRRGMYGKRCYILLVVIIMTQIQRRELHGSLQ